MTLRISLTDDESAAVGIPIVPSSAPSHSTGPTAPVFADWDDDQSPVLLLYLPDEPEIGLRFQYSGVDWEIVDYRDGWVARLLVD
jgi:hypothetical protein